MLDSDSKIVHDRILGNLLFPRYDMTISGVIQKVGCWEPNEIDLILNFVKEGDVCINVGSNIGYFTCFMSRQVGHSGKVFSIEANPRLEKYLRHNISNLEHNNVELIMCAAGDVTGETILYINDINSGDNRVFDSNHGKYLRNEGFGSDQKEVVKIDLVDNLVNSKRVDFILTDCQGWDYKVIRGMKRIIEDNKPKILFEFIPRTIAEHGEDPVAVLSEFVDLGYSLFCPDLIKDREYSPEEAVKSCVSSNSYINIFMIPSNNVFS